MKPSRSTRNSSTRSWPTRRYSLNSQKSRTTVCSPKFAFARLMQSFADPESDDSLDSYSHSHTNGGDGHSHSHDHSGRHTHSHGSSDHGTNEGDMDKVRSTLKQLVRDWSEEVSD